MHVKARIFFNHLVAFQDVRNREIVPVKPFDVEMDLHRFTTTTHHYEPPPPAASLPPQNRKFSSWSNLNKFIYSLVSLSRTQAVFSFIVLSSHCLFIPLVLQSGQHQHQPTNINKRMILPIKRQTPAGIVVDLKKNTFSKQLSTILSFSRPCLLSSLWN